MKAGGRAPAVPTRQIFGVSVMCRADNPGNDMQRATCTHIIGYVTTRLPHGSLNGVLPQFNGESNYDIGHTPGTNEYGPQLQQFTSMSPMLLTKPIDVLTAELGITTPPSKQRSGEKDSTQPPPPAMPATRESCPADKNACLDAQEVLSFMKGASAMICWHIEEKGDGAASGVISECVSLPFNSRTFVNPSDNFGLNAMR